MDVRAEEDALLPVEGLGHERHVRGATATEEDRRDRHAGGVLPLGGDGRALVGRRREAGVGVGGRRVRRGFRDGREDQFPGDPRPRAHLHADHRRARRAPQSRADGGAEPLGPRHELHGLDRSGERRGHRHLGEGSRAHDSRGGRARCEAVGHRAAGTRVSAHRATGRCAGSRRAHRSMLRSRGVGGTHSGGRAVRNHERRRHHGASSRSHRLRAAPRS